MDGELEGYKDEEMEGQIYGEMDRWRHRYMARQINEEIESDVKMRKVHWM